MSNQNNGVLDGLRRIGGRFRDLAVDGGLPGLPYGVRLRGATGTGPPLTGTHKAGDMVPDRAGNLWFCTAAGTPGTWAGTYPDQSPALQHGLQSAAGLTSLYAAIAGRATARCDILALGDSIEFGQGADTWLDTWVQQANIKIRVMYPTTTGLVNAGANTPMGGQGFIPVLPTTGSSTYTSPWTVTGGSGSADVGPVRNAQLMAGVSTTCTWTAPAGSGTTNVKLMHFNQGGTYSYQVASGSTNNVSTTTAHTDTLTSLISISAGQLLTIRWVSGTVVFDGLIHYAGDETSGVTFHNMGHAGWKASDWTGPETLESANWAQVLTTFSPAAILIGLGGNDAQSQTVAVFTADLQALVTLVRAQSGLSTLPVIFHTTYQANAVTVDPGGWPAYIAAIRAIANANPYCAVIDTNYRWPSYASDFAGDSLYYTAGGGGGVGVHPSPLGHALFAELITRGLSIG